MTTSAPIVSLNVNVAAQQVMNMAVQAMQLNIFAQALGIMASGAALNTPLTAQTPTQPAVKELGRVYGAQLTMKVLNENPGADIATLAAALEVEATEDMRRTYGNQITDMALATADPLDYKGALRIAESIKTKGVLPAAAKAATGKAKVAGTGNKRGGKKPGQPQRDTKTGIVYPTKSAAARAVLDDYKGNPNIKFVNANGTKNSFVWYDIVKVDPKRFEKFEGKLPEAPEAEGEGVEEV